MKLWAGRIQQEADARLNDFNASIRFDSRLYKQDIGGSMAHATMLRECGIITPAECDQILTGLSAILRDLESGELGIDPESEDIHTFVEAELTARIGDAGKKLHTARSRNDQVALDLRLYLRDELSAVTAMLRTLTGVLCDKAEEHTETIMPGYTHLQRAQPITFAHHLLAWAQMLLRDIGRLEDCYRRMNRSPLGCGALAATSYPIDRDMTAQLLGFDGPVLNSLDGVSDRDFCVEFVSALALVMTHLSRACEEIILWCSWEFKFIELDDRFATGSSIMPQKKNPDIPELVRGKTGRVNGDLIALLTMLKGLPLAYNKDMQEDKEAVFDACDTVKMALDAFTPMVETMAVNTQRMRAAVSGGFLNATDCADYLTRKGLPFRDAYKITGTLVAYCIEQGETLETLPLEQYRQFSEEFSEDIYEAVALETCLNSRNVLGGPAGEQVRLQLADIRDQLGAQ
ncbi:MAG: argininosuccinate lyase [Provencibacterium sp.]|jgi:argininosuccinate lyase|nr:argininosuccinate lyase [Provencibacterium sp.]